MDNWGLLRKSRYYRTYQDDTGCLQLWHLESQFKSYDHNVHYYKANLRDLIAATGLVILLKLDSNRRVFSPCDLEIWWMTPKNNRACLLYYIKLCASFQIHQWIQTGVTVRKRPIWVKIDNFFKPYDLEIWRLILKNNRAPLLCYFKLCPSFHSYWWIQTGVTVRKRPIWVQIDDFF